MTLEIIRSDNENLLPWHGTLTAISHLHGGTLELQLLHDKNIPPEPEEIATKVNLKFAIRSLVEKEFNPAVDRQLITAGTLQFFESQAPPPDVAIGNIHEEAARTRLIPGQNATLIRIDTSAQEGILPTDPESQFESYRVYL